MRPAARHVITGGTKRFTIGMPRPRGLTGERRRRDDIDRRRTCANCMCWNSLDSEGARRVISCTPWMGITWMPVRVRERVVNAVTVHVRRLATGLAITQIGCGRTRESGSAPTRIRCVPRERGSNGAIRMPRVSEAPGIAPTTWRRCEPRRVGGSGITPRYPTEIGTSGARACLAPRWKTLIVLWSGSEMVVGVIFAASSVGKMPGILTTLCRLRPGGSTPTEMLPCRIQVAIKAKGRAGRGR